MTLRGHQLGTSTQRNARKRASKDRGCISQRGDEVRERFRSKSDCTGTSGEEGGGGKGGEDEKGEVDLHKRSWLGRASRVSPRRVGAEKVTRNCLNLPDWQPPCAPFPRTGYCSHERANHSSNNNPSPSASSHLTQRAFVRLLSRRAGGLFYSRYSLGTRCIFNLCYYFIFTLLSPRLWRMPGRSFWKLHESRITSCTLPAPRRVHRARGSLIRDISGLI